MHKSKNFERGAGARAINGLRSAKYMVENLPPRRPIYGRNHAAACTPDERDRRAPQCAIDTLNIGFWRIWPGEAPWT
jgi:hypothetical protein